MRVCGWEEQRSVSRSDVRPATLVCLCTRGPRVRGARWRLLQTARYERYGSADCFSREPTPLLGAWCCTACSAATARIAQLARAGRCHRMYSDRWACCARGAEHCGEPSAAERVRVHAGQHEEDSAGVRGDSGRWAAGKVLVGCGGSHQLSWQLSPQRPSAATAPSSERGRRPESQGSWAL